MPIQLKQDILAMCHGQQTTLAAVGQLDAQLGALFGEAVLSLLKQTGIPAQYITARQCGINLKGIRGFRYNWAITTVSLR